ATTGFELWRFAGAPSPVRATHYRGAGEAGFESSPVITGDIVWAADTAGVLSALDLHSGMVLWQTELGTPVLGGLAVSGDWLVTATYDGTVRGMVAASSEPIPPTPLPCAVEEPAGCCDTGRSASPLGAPALALLAFAAARRRRA